MKKYSLFLLMVACIVCLCGCSKAKSCHCKVVETDQHQTVTGSNVNIKVDGSVECEDITELGDEWTTASGFNSSRNKISCSEE